MDEISALITGFLQSAITIEKTREKLNFTAV